MGPSRSRRLGELNRITYNPQDFQQPTSVPHASSHHSAVRAEYRDSYGDVYLDDGFTDERSIYHDAACDIDEDHNRADIEEFEAEDEEEEEEHYSLHESSVESGERFGRRSQYYQQARNDNFNARAVQSNGRPVQSQQPMRSYAPRPASRDPSRSMHVFGNEGPSSLQTRLENFQVQRPRRPQPLVDVEPERNPTHERTFPSSPTPVHAYENVVPNLTPATVPLHLEFTAPRDFISADVQYSSNGQANAAWKGVMQ
jgi:hypothetical protein